MMITYHTSPAALFMTCAAVVLVILTGHFLGDSLNQTFDESLYFFIAYLLHAHTFSISISIFCSLDKNSAFQHWLLHYHSASFLNVKLLWNPSDKCPMFLRNTHTHTHTFKHNCITCDSARDKSLGMWWTLSSLVFMTGQVFLCRCCCYCCCNFSYWCC